MVRVGGFNPAMYLEFERLGVWDNILSISGIWGGLPTRAFFGMRCTRFSKGFFMDLCLRFCESEIEYWAERYIQCQKVSSRKWEQHLIERKKDIRREECMTLDELYDISYWKSRRQSKRVHENNCEAKVNQVTKAAFASDNDWKKLEILMDLDGISYARASAILHLYDARCYPIIDVYAVWSVNKNETVKNWYTKKFWCVYVPFCRGLASRNGIDMRTVDRALMHYGYIHSEI